MSHYHAPNERACANCGALLKRKAHGRLPRTYCSKECQHALHGYVMLHDEVTCRETGETMTLEKWGQKIAGELFRTRDGQPRLLSKRVARAVRNREAYRGLTFILTKKATHEN